MSIDESAFGPLLRAIDTIGDLCKLARRHDWFLWHQPEFEDDVPEGAEAPELTEEDLASVRAAVARFQEELPRLWEVNRSSIRAWRRERGGPPERLVTLAGDEVAPTPACRADETVELALDLDARLRKQVIACGEEDPLDVEELLAGWDLGSGQIAATAPGPEVLDQLRSEVIEEFRRPPRRCPSTRSRRRPARKARRARSSST